MLIGMYFGLGLGTLAGLSVGPYLFGKYLSVPKKYSTTLSEAADSDRLVEQPEAGTPVTAEYRAVLPFTDPWAMSPDHEKVAMINRILAVMWPNITKAVLTKVLNEVAKPQLESKVFAKFPFIEDIVLGTMSMRDSNSWDTWIKDKAFTLGSVPPRLGGIKNYGTADDEVMLEVPLIWGSNVKLDVGVFLRFGPVRLYVPVEISNIQFMIEPRITIKPLVEDIPCLGGVSITLVKPPHVDLSVKIIQGIDLLALPILQDIIKFAITYVLNGMLIYPNNMTFPIMPNFGVPPPPKGALKVQLLKGQGIKGADDAFVKLEVRQGRAMVSRTVPNKANGPDVEWNQEFNLVIDSLIEQQLTLIVFDDDLGWNDDPVSMGFLPFGEVRTDLALTAKTPEEAFMAAEFIKNPNQEVLLSVPLFKIAKGSNVFNSIKSLNRMPSLVGGGKSVKSATPVAAPSTLASSPSMAKPLAQTWGSMAVMPAEPMGHLFLKVTYLPFLQPTYDDEDEEDAKKKPKKPLPPRPAGREVNHNIHDKTKGVLTLKLIRGINLMGDDPNVYVRIVAVDEESDGPDLEHRSTTVFAQNCPRWGDNFDFVMISAGSTLHVTVYDKASLGSSLFSTVNVFKKKKKEQDADTVLGKLTLPVRDVARNGTLKDIWTLQDTEKGQVELLLTWKTCEMPDN